MPRPAHRGRLRRRARVGAGCGVLRVRLVTAPREAPGKTALPPLRAERANAPMRDPRAPLMCNARRFRQGGSGANNRRGGAPRGERPASWDVGRPRWRLRAYVIRPPTGAAAPERLSALRFPRCREGRLANLGAAIASRERYSMSACPGRTAARSDAVQTRDPGFFAWSKEPGSRISGAPLRLRSTLHRVRDTRPCHIAKPSRMPP